MNEDEYARQADLAMEEYRYNQAIQELQDIQFSFLQVLHDLGVRHER